MKALVSGIAMDLTVYGFGTWINGGYVGIYTMDE